MMEHQIEAGAAPAVEFRNVGLCYQSPEGETEALENLSFRVEQGELLILLGPSGC